jgi:cytochrome c biogenesis protein CcdA
MEAWINQVFSAPEFGLLVLPAGLLFGLITAIACLGCSAPIIAAVIGYAGSREGQERRDIFVIAGFFMLGTVLALAAAGWLIGYIGQAAGSTFGLYGKIFIAIVVIFFGFAALNILPFKLPSINPVKSNLPGGLLGASIFGLAVGGASTAYTMGCCGPVLLPIVLGLSMLKGQPGWGALILAMFAVGYSLPMVAVILGVGIGKLSIISNKIAGPIRIVSGILLIGAGFWLLFTL